MEHNNHVIDADQAGRMELQLTDDGFVSSIVRRTEDGSITWRLNPPGNIEDVFVSVELRPGQLVGTSWSGWRVETDLLSGTETGRSFTK